MTELIGRELHTCGVMLCYGMALMLVFAARDALTARCGRRRRAARAVYLCGWLCAGYLFTEFLYAGSRGVVSFHGIMAMGCGIILWKKLVCGIIMNTGDSRGGAAGKHKLHKQDRDEGYEEEEKRENPGI